MNDTTPVQQTTTLPQNPRISVGHPDINGMYVTNRRGDIPNLTKAEFVTLMLQYAPEALCLKDRETLAVEFEDGRILTFYHIVFPAQRHLPELREWAVHLYTLKQRTERCLRKWHERKAWLYIAPYTEEKGYTTDPSRTWSYKVWG
jgi:hypothetical protein